MVVSRLGASRSAISAPRLACRARARVDQPGFDLHHTPADAAKASESFGA